MPPTRPSRPLRSQLTSRLFARWEQRQWTSLKAMRASVAHEQDQRRRRALLLAILVVGTAAAGLLLYLLLYTPAH